MCQAWDALRGQLIRHNADPCSPIDRISVRSVQTSSSRDARAEWHTGPDMGGFPWHSTRHGTTLIRGTGDENHQLEAQLHATYSGEDPAVQ
ncbi:hypothetical protein LZ32DRAFT_203917 [Colletotrichum eremochloae]|nr:hypothetical protein LZ32DRAFT_203917 [Colletotrichum eremochloae]